MTPAAIIEHAHLVPGLNCKGELHGTTCRAIQDAMTSAVDAAVNLCAQKALDLRGQAAAAAQQAQREGNVPAAAFHAGAANMADMLNRIVLLPEDGCRTCLNSRQVPSTVVAGQFTKCPACANREAETPVLEVS